MQQRSGTERRRATDRDAAQTLGRQPQGDGEDDLEPPRTPLSAREFEHPLRRAGDRASQAAVARRGSAPTDEEKPQGRSGGEPE